MTVTSIYPVLLTADVDAAAAFFREHFGFEVTFGSDWYVSLRSGVGELAVLDARHETIPEPWRGVAAGGLLVNIEVDDVDDEYRRLVEEGSLDAVLPIRSEAFGQRHFIVAGPEGVLVDVITPIPPEEEFVEQFTAAAD